MSAIFGILDLPGRPLEQSWIKSMQTDLAHRGPDGEGLYEETGLALGHKLLQVTPESRFDVSPYDEDGFVITANARLDERNAIMDRLSLPEIERETITDPLLLLRSFRKFGKEFVKDIYGDFAFAIWDKQKKELFCARDQMGVKPFLYYFKENRFVFSSEFKSIVKLGFVQTEVDQNCLRDESIWLFDKPKRTPWKNISRLESAHTLTLTKTGFSLCRYWKPEISGKKSFKTEEECSLELKRILERVITDHCRVTGEVGVPLSGGLDSTTIACLAAKKFAKEGKKITTVSSILNPTKSEPGEKDEMEYIEEVLNQENNIDALFIYHSDLSLTEHLDEKFNRNFTPVNIFHYVDEALNEQLKRKSIRRALSGLLGDVTTSNSSIKPLPILLLNGKFKTFYQTLISVKKGMGLSFFAIFKSLMLKPLLPLFLLNVLYYLKKADKPWNVGLLPLRFENRTLNVVKKRKKLIFKENNTNPFEIRKKIWPDKNKHFAEYWDCESSHHQIEYTFPLFDRRIVEFLIDIPVQNFYAGGLKRGLIRKAMIGVMPVRNRMRMDKMAYSPGYHQIIRNDIVKIASFLTEKKVTNQLKELVNINEMKIWLKKIAELKIFNTFEGKYYTIIDLSVWISFCKWVSENYFLNLKENEKRKETVEQTNH